MIPVSCTMCQFYTPDLTSKNNTGICRRHPPRAFLVPQGAVAVWPIVKPSDWCAEGEAGVSTDSKKAGEDLMNGRH